MKNILSVIIMFCVVAFSATAQRHHISFDEAAPPPDGYILSYNGTSGHYEWVPSPAVSGFPRIDATLLASANDFQPAGWNGSVSTLRINTTGNYQVTGLLATFDGHRVMICSSGGDTTLKKNAGASAPANRFGAADDIKIKDQTCAWAQYDGAAQRWFLATKW